MYVMSAALSVSQVHWCKDGHVVPLPFVLRDASPPLLQNPSQFPACIQNACLTPSHLALQWWPDGYT